MGNYLNIVNLIEEAADAVNPDGRFIDGRLVDFSQSFTGAYPLITLLPFTINDSLGEPFDWATVTIGFWKEDRPDTSHEERRDIIGEMDELASDLVTYLLDNSDTYTVTNLTREPQYQMFQGTLSGMAVQFRIDIQSPC
jgi:hypothetical protein